MGTVLLRMRGEDALRVNPQTDPPHTERRQAMQSGRRERDPIVGPDRPWEAVLAEQLLEHRPRAQRPRGAEPGASQEIARVQVGHGERVAILVVARAELAFEVRGPQIVRRVCRRRHDTGMGCLVPRPPRLDQPTAFQQITRGTDRRPVHTAACRGRSQSSNFSGPQSGC